MGESKLGNIAGVVCIILILLWMILPFFSETLRFYDGILLTTMLLVAAFARFIQWISKSEPSDEE